MRRRTLVNIGLVTVLTASVWGVALAGSSSQSAASGHVFATADGMVSTIESFIKVMDFEAAEKAALELTEHSPDFLQGWMLLGYCQSLNQKFSESNAAYEKALMLGAESNAIKARMAYNHIRLGEFNEARYCYRAILELEPGDAEALQQLGYLEGKLGNYDLAADYYKRVLESDPENVEIIRALAKIEERRGGNGAVRELLIRNLDLHPNDTESLARLGRVYIKEKNYKAAIEILEKLVALEPANDKGWRNLGVARYQLGDKRAACADFQRVKDLGGDMTDLYGPLAECYYESGAGSAAIGIIKEGIQREMQVAWLYCVWGKVLEGRKSYDAAIGKFVSAARMNEEPWSDYARKQIARQEKLKKRAAMISAQEGME
jgi:tetratricopeptide (TPR) repeat protein